MISFASETDLPRTIAVKLLRLRLALAQWLWVDGLRICLWTLLAVCLADYVLDRLFDFDRAQRAICLAAGVGAILVVGWRRLVRPLGEPWTIEALCRTVEDRHPELRERLLTAVQLARARRSPNQTASSQLIKAAIEQGVAAAAGIDFAAVVDSRAMRRNLLQLAAAAFAFGGVLAGVAYANSLQIWFQRNLLLRDVSWPRQTQLELIGVDDAAVRVARGDDWEQRVRARGRIPEWMQIDFRSPQWRRPATGALTRSRDDEFLAVVKQVGEPFQFRVRGGDATTRWIDVELVEKPAVQELQIVAAPPGYTGESPVELPSGQGSHDVLPGTRIDFHGRSNKRLVGVRLHALRAAEPSGAGSNQPPPSAAAEPPEIVGQIDSAAPTDFRLTLPAERLESQTYAIELQDADGLRSGSAARATFRVAPDQPPQVKARLRDVGPLVCPTARLPLSISASDDFAVREVRVRYAVRREGSDEPPRTGELPLDSAAAEPADADPQRLRQWSLDYDWSPEALELAPGMTVSFHAAAEDNDALSGPNVGRSEDLVVKVVSEDEYRADLLRREKNLRGELETELNRQELLATDVAALAAALGDAQPPSAEQRQSLASIHRGQQSSSERIAGLAAGVERLASEVANNRLEPSSGPIQSRLAEQVAAPLAQIAAEPCAMALAELDRARQFAGDAVPRDAALDAALAAQRQSAAALRDVVAGLAKSAGFQEAVNLLQSILRSQQELREGTLKAGDESLRQLKGPNP